MNKWLIVFCFLGFQIAVNAQEEKPKNWTLNGYVKNLESGFFFNGAYPDLATLQLVDTFLQDNLLHNRLNFSWFPTSKLTLHAELRNRLFWGDQVRATPDYAKQIDEASNDVFNLSAILLDQNGFVFHSGLDRLYLEWLSGKWEVRLGRQRVNWGISSVWNPNDVFNAFSYTDFDYEERPGSDAVRVKYYTGFASSIEVAAKAFENFDEAVIAGLWRFNRWNYDFQLLGGYVKGDLALGGGWAGNLKNAGLKGEFTYFIPTEEENDPAFAATVGIDYSFANSLYINAGLLYNSDGATKGSAGDLFNFELSARNLYPYQYAVFLQGTYPFTPLLNGGLALIYSPVSAQALFLNPNFTLSIAQNWDLDLIGQIVFSKEEKYKSPVQAAFLRLKFSF
ncbi:MAG: hypothetical protein DHS20C18_26280 [Saprospiraceae bacterium]|nr:MAG: hypothetical protein DHS20C18_26280 [Saprospiraceae bacterium]